ncbi:hypothetical protein K2173_000228 [Erythroxylum novogranatense]|uniref:VQ domain-containing protein n=1 Tax=Erythroxylum novogranatense TaxID=1862640 RepID=A0AAV8SVW5_9ROSI|nr:hypothetical protein K2173_000228 [Erythroxylum novogranatense]
MSPAKFDHHQEQRVINGPRPTPLKINTESHVIHKTTSFSSLGFSSSASATELAPVIGAARQKQRNHPVIIYTHSPKVLHTQARDFMALVQKLTGNSTSNDDVNDHVATAVQQVQQQKISVVSEGSKSKLDFDSKKLARIDDNESSSVLTEGNCGRCDDEGVNNGGAIVNTNSRILNQIKNPSFTDIPLFTPNSSKFFCSPGPAYMFSDSVYPSPNMTNPISPSFLEFIKGISEC